MKKVIGLSVISILIFVFSCFGEVDKIDDLTLTDTSVWYPYTLPENTVAFSVKARTGYDVKVSKESTGTKCITIWAGDTFPFLKNSGNILYGTYYFNCPEKENIVLEILTRRKQ